MTTIKPIMVLLSRWWYASSLKYNKERHGEKNLRILVVVSSDIGLPRPVFGIMAVVVAYLDSINDYYSTNIGYIEQMMVCKVIRIQ